MLIASIEPKKVDEQVLNGMSNVAIKILENLQSQNDINLQDVHGNTCLHIGIKSNNKAIFKEILNLTRPNMDIKNNANELPLWLALLKSEQDGNLILMKIMTEPLLTVIFLLF